MHFIFSQREKARQAAIAAHERYEAEQNERAARGEPRLEYFGCVVNAALEALDEPKDTGSRRELRAALEKAGATNPTTDNLFGVGVSGAGQMLLLRPPLPMQMFSKADALLLAAWLVALAEDTEGQFAAAQEAVRR